MKLAVPGLVRDWCHAGSSRSECATEVDHVTRQLTCVEGLRRQFGLPDKALKNL